MSNADLQEAKIALLNAFCSSTRPSWLPDSERGEPHIMIIQKRDLTGYLSDDVLEAAMKALLEQTVIYTGGAWRVVVQLNVCVECPLCGAPMTGYVTKSFSGVTLNVIGGESIEWDTDVDGFENNGILTGLLCPDCGVDLFEGAVVYVSNY